MLKKLVQTKGARALRGLESEDSFQSATCPAFSEELFLIQWVISIVRNSRNINGITPANLFVVEIQDMKFSNEYTDFYSRHRVLICVSAQPLKVK